MKYQDYSDKPIGGIIYLTGLSGDVPAEFPVCNTKNE